MSEETAPGLLLTVRFTLPLDLSDTLIAEMASVPDTSLANGVISTSWEKTPAGWDILWLIDQRPPLPALLTQLKKLAPKLKLTTRDFKVEPVGDVNWLEQSYRQFPAFRIKSFYVHGSHCHDPIPRGMLPLQIDAATAFGSGEHGTTRGCVEALCKLKTDAFKPRRILDMGTGSGILGIAAHKLWRKPVLAVDNDPEATRVAARHRKLNGLTAQDMICKTGDGYKTRQVQSGKPYDLIIANILAQPLIDMAPQLEVCLSRNGRVVLSGLLTTQAAAVLKAHKAVGLKKVSAIKHQDWATLILSRAL